MPKFKKPLTILLSTIIILVVLVIIFISPITKYLVQKYDVQFTGREITMDWAYVNPFTGYIHFRNFKIYEYKSDSTFASTSGLTANVAVSKLLSKNYEIEYLTLDNFNGTINKNDKIFNFDDLILKFSSKDTTVPKKPAVHFNLLNLAINNASIYFHDKQIQVNYLIKKVNITSPGLRWSDDAISVKFSFIPGIGNGNVEGDFGMNTKNLDYKFKTKITKYDLQVVEQYLKELTNYGTFRANLDANISAVGNFADSQNITAKGMIAINDFHFGKNRKEDYASFKKVAFVIDELSPKFKKYLFDSVTLNSPYFKYELYDKLDNIQYIFGKEGANVKAVNKKEFNLVIEIANYIKVLSKNFLRSNYKVNRFRVFDANIIYNDFSLSEKFTASLNPLSISADSVNKNNNRVKLIVKSGIKPYGNLILNVSINPKDSSDFDIQYYIQKISLAALNPYIITYTEFPIDRGILEINGNWHVQNGNINSMNHILVIDPRVTTRQKNKNTRWLPMRLAMAFVRERGNVIDYEVPISGNLNNPKFKFKDVIKDVLTNIVVKPLTTPYGIEVRKVETEIEKSLSLHWKMRSTTLTNSQENFVEKIAIFLKDNPTAKIIVEPLVYYEKEMEYILLFEAKKKYYLEIHKIKIKYLTEKDSSNINKMSVKDSLFVRYLDKQNKGKSMLYTIQSKCAAILDSYLVKNKFSQKNEARKHLFMQYMKLEGVQTQVVFYKSKNVVPFNGFTQYKISYKNEFPESLLKAYKKMNELNDESPRDKFRKERRKYRML